MLKNALWFQDGERKVLFCGRTFSFFELKPGQSTSAVETLVQQVRTWRSLDIIRPTVPNRGFKHSLGNAVFEVTQQCTGVCAYCYIHRNHRQRSGPMMSQEIADRAVDLLSRRCAELVSLSFIGGEPLLNLPIVGHILSRLERAGIRVLRKSLFTSAIAPASVLIDATAMSLQFGIRWVVSCDGPAEIHDLNRGHGSYEHTSSAIRMLQASGVEFDLAATYTPAHKSAGFLPTDVECHLRRQFPFVQKVSIALVWPTTPEFAFPFETIREINLNRLQKVENALFIFAHATRVDDVQLPRETIRPISAYMYRVRDDRVCPVSPASKLAFGALGGVYPCFHFADRDDARYLGAANGLHEPEWFMEINRKGNRMPCAECFARYLCFGCPARVVRTGALPPEQYHEKRRLSGQCARLPFFETIMRFLHRIENNPYLACRIRQAIEKEI